MFGELKQNPDLWHFDGFIRLFFLFERAVPMNWMVYSNGFLETRIALTFCICVSLDSDMQFSRVVFERLSI